ncbi:50S ribosomal protein L34e [archaeon]|jgi:large subunit ribosomal protein L34e|nr:50S ribosomal protein L34e [archaeon]MBT6824019.1 50S ribosomal protein L34e [archaeon]MBT7107252.1 50S ribosomal protein L34e [archaeon]MBT7297173.1 50S ribosomal protein L34e [archaeon]
MPAGKHKSRTLRRVFVKSPGGNTKIQYRKRKTAKLTCVECGKGLHGIPNLIRSRFKNLPKSKKKPQRPYGGNLCSACTRKKMLLKAKSFMEKKK